METTIEKKLSEPDIYDIVEYNCTDIESIYFLLDKLVTPANMINMKNILVYSFVKILRDHPEWIKGLYKIIVLYSSKYSLMPYPIESIFYHSMYIAFKKGFIKPSDVLSIINCSDLSEIRSQEVSRWYQSICYLVKDKGLDRDCFYNNLSFSKTGATQEIIAMAIEDFYKTDKKVPSIFTVIENGLLYNHVNADKADMIKSVANTDNYINFLANFTTYLIIKSNASYSTKVSNIAFFAKFLPEDSIPLYTEKLKELNTCPELYQSLDYSSKKIGYLLGTYDDIFITEKTISEEYIKLVPYIPEYRFKEIISKVYTKSVYTTALLNNSAIKKNREILKKLLLLYLKSDTIIERKLEKHKLLLDAEDISDLSPRNTLKLLSRSINTDENGIPEPVRFTFTDDAVKVLQKKILPLLMLREYSDSSYKKLYSNFVSLYSISATNTPINN